MAAELFLHLLGEFWRSVGADGEVDLLGCAPRSDSRGMRAGIAIRRFRRRPARLTRTRLVRPFKKGDRPLCPPKMRFGRLRVCGLGTERSVPFFEPGVPLVPEKREPETETETGQMELLSCGPRSDSRGLRGGIAIR